MLRSEASAIASVLVLLLAGVCLGTVTCPPDRQIRGNASASLPTGFNGTVQLLRSPGFDRSQLSLYATLVTNNSYVLIPQLSGLWVVALGNDTNCSFRNRWIPAPVVLPSISTVVRGTLVRTFLPTDDVYGALSCFQELHLNSVVQDEVLLVHAGQQNVTAIVHCQSPTGLLTATSTSIFTVLERAPEPRIIATPSPFVEQIVISFESTVSNATILYYVARGNVLLQAPSFDRWSRFSQPLTLSQTSVVLAVVIAPQYEPSDPAMALFQRLEGAEAWKYYLGTTLVALAVVAYALYCLARAATGRPLSLAIEAAVPMACGFAEVGTFITDIMFIAGALLTTPGVGLALRVIYVLVMVASALCLAQRSLWAVNKRKRHFTLFLPVASIWAAFSKDVDDLLALESDLLMWTGAQRILHDIPTLAISAAFALQHSFATNDYSVIKLFWGIACVALSFRSIFYFLLVGPCALARRLCGEEPSRGNTPNTHRSPLQVKYSNIGSMEQIPDESTLWRDCLCAAEISLLNQLRRLPPGDERRGAYERRILLIQEAAAKHDLGDQEVLQMILGDTADVLAVTSNPQEPNPLQHKAVPAPETRTSSPTERLGQDKDYLRFPHNHGYFQQHHHHHHHHQQLHHQHHHFHAAPPTAASTQRQSVTHQRFSSEPFAGDQVLQHAPSGEVPVAEKSTEVRPVIDQKPSAEEVESGNGRMLHHDGMTTNSRASTDHPMQTETCLNPPQLAAPSCSVNNSTATHQLLDNPSGGQNLGAALPADPFAETIGATAMRESSPKRGTPTMDQRSATVLRLVASSAPVGQQIKTLSSPLRPQPNSQPLQNLANEPSSARSGQHLSSEPFSDKQERQTPSRASEEVTSTSIHDLKPVDTIGAPQHTAMTMPPESPMQKIGSPTASLMDDV